MTFLRSEDNYGIWEMAEDYQHIDLGLEAPRAKTKNVSNWSWDHDGSDSDAILIQ